MEPQPLISIITVSYNSEEYIEKTIKSVLNQTYTNIEYLIVDGQSTDGTLGIVREYEPKFEGRMRWVSEPDEGLYDAMNKGIKMADGEIIGIINSDDWYELEAVEKVVEAYKNTNADVVYGDMYKWDGDNSYFFEGDIHSDNLDKLNINHPTVFIKKQIYEKYGGFDTRFPLGADRDLILRLLNNGVNFRKICSVLANWRYGGASSSYSIKFIFKKLSLHYKLLRKNNFSLFYSIKRPIFKTARLLRNYLISRFFGDSTVSKLRKIRYKNNDKKHT